jgi:hypothetical protein
MTAQPLTRRSLHDEFAFLLDSTVDLPADKYDRDTLLMRLEVAARARMVNLEQEAERLRGSVTATRIVEAEARALDSEHERDLLAARVEWAKNVIVDSPLGVDGLKPIIAALCATDDEVRAWARGRGK